MLCLERTGRMKGLLLIYSSINGAEQLVVTLWCAMHFFYYIKTFFGLVLKICNSILIREITKMYKKIFFFHYLSFFVSRIDFHETWG